MKLKDICEALDESDDITDSTIWYHGSKVGGVTRFDRKYIGSGVVGSNDTGGFYFSMDRNAAKYFADEEYIEKESDEEWNTDDITIYGEDKYYFLLHDINRGPYDTEDNALAAAQEIVDKHNSINVGDMVYHDEKVSAYFLTLENPVVVHDSMDTFRRVASTAQADGYDAVIGKDMYDGDMVSTIALVFDPARIRPAT